MEYDVEIVLAFLDEVEEYVPQLRQHLATLTNKPKARDALDECYRLSHSIKGSAAMLELEDLRAEGLAMEQALVPVVEKREVFTPALGQNISQHVNMVERLVGEHRQRLSEPAQPAEPVAPLIIPPDNFGDSLGDDFKFELEELTPPPVPSVYTNGTSATALPDAATVSTNGHSDHDWLKDELFNSIFDGVDLPILDSKPPAPETIKAAMPYPHPALEGHPPAPAYSPLNDSEANRPPLINLDVVVPSRPLSPQEITTLPPHQVQPETPAWLDGLDDAPTIQHFQATPTPPPAPLASQRPSPGDLQGLNDILATDAIDRQIDRLQQEILPHMAVPGSNKPVTAELELPSELDMSDAALLEALGRDIDLSDLTSPGEIENLPVALTSSPEENIGEPAYGYDDATALLADLDDVTHEPEVLAAAEEALTLDPSFAPPELSIQTEADLALQSALLSDDTAEELSSLDDIMPQVISASPDEEEAAIAAAIAAMQQEGDGFEGEDADGFGFDPGPLFLAEAMGDLEKLQELVTEFPTSDDPAEVAGQIEARAGTMRKAADLMGLEQVSLQLHTIEGLGQFIKVGDMASSDQTAAMLQSSLDDLLYLFEPWQSEAAALLAPPVPELSEEEAAVEAVPRPLPVAPSRTIEASEAGIDPEMTAVFTEEAEEHIQNLDTRLAALERDPDNRELVREIRRTAHTLKGSAAMVGLNTISQTAHLMEDLLDRLYEGSVAVDGEVVELLFATFNAMDGMVRNVAADKPENPAALEDLRPRYADLLSGEAAEEVEGGGAIIFERRTTAPATIVPDAFAEPEAISGQLVSEEHVAALETAQAQQVALEQAEHAREIGTAIAVPGATPLITNEQLGVRVPIKGLDDMINQVGELVINRTVLEQRAVVFNRAVEELSLSLKRLQKVARELETRYEVELLKTSAAPLSDNRLRPTASGYNRGGTGLEEAPALTTEFDNLEMDQYTEFHQLSREMSETVADLATAQKEMDTLRDELESIAIQQGRVTDDLQDKLVKVRLVALSNLTPRLYRTVRTVAASQGKDVQFVVSGDDTPVDKVIFENIGDPLLHLIRNAIDHGIETKEARLAAGKSAAGIVTFAARTEGSQVVIEIRDDGIGINKEALRQRGIAMGLIRADRNYSDDEIYNLMFRPGFSTAQTISEISGRGVGLDIVQSNILALKGTIEVSSQPGQGTAFSIRLPNTLAITRAVLMRAGGYSYAVPLSAIERTSRLDQGAVTMIDGRAMFRLEGETEVMPLLDMAELLQLPVHLRRNPADEDDMALHRDQPILVISGAERRAIRVDKLVGQQEVVVKSLGKHLKVVPGVLGSTVLGSGEVILILNVYELLSMAAGARQPNIAVRTRFANRPVDVSPRSAGTTGNLPPLTSGRRLPVIQVVDDSLSIRKVLSGMLEKAGFRVRTSKDGQEALETVQQSLPDLIIMDIEMPRMDGYELTSILKSRPDYQHVPIVMLTSRAGLKHRQKAQDVGADGFLVKPYKEEELLQIVSTLLLRGR